MSRPARLGGFAASLLAAAAAALVSAAPALAVPPTPDFTGVPVEGYTDQAPYLCQTSDPHRFGVEGLRELLLDAYPASRPGATWAPCDTHSPTSEHHAGRAFDWHPGEAGAEPSSAAKADGDEVTRWILATVDGTPHMRLRRLGIRYMIWANQIWTASTRTWQQYQDCSGTNGDPTTCHRDHVHFSFGADGADGDTSWWNGRPDPTLPRRPLCVPVPGDWDGNGSTTVGVACLHQHRIAWRGRNAHSAGGAEVRGDYGNWDPCVPLSGDWNGDGRFSAGVACQSGINISFRLSNEFDGSPSYPAFNFGNSNSCTPITGDWDGNGTTTVGVACKAGIRIEYSLINSHTGGSPSYPPFGFGNANSCRPVTGDWDGNGTTTVGAACLDGIDLRWDLNNQQSSGGIAYTPFRFGNSASYQPTTGWGGPTWPTWPENI